METKAQIRKRIIQVRNQMLSEDVSQKSSLIAQKVLKTPEYEEADNVLLYAVLMLVSGSMLIILGIIWKRNRHEETN